MCYPNTVRVIQTLCKLWADLLPVLLLTLGKHSNINRSPALRLDSGKASMGFLWWAGPFTIYLWSFLCWRYVLFHHLGFTLWPFVLWWPDLPPPLCFPKGEGAFITIRLFKFHFFFFLKEKKKERKCPVRQNIFGKDKSCRFCWQQQDTPISTVSLL